MIDAGVRAKALLSLRLTVTPLTGTKPWNTARGETELPPTTGLGVKAKADGASGIRVKPADRVVPPYSAVTVAGVAALTGKVDTVKVFESVPAATLTVVGTRT